jgi:hypothetical protein
MFGRVADAEGALYWTNQLHNLRSSGMSKADADALIESQMLQAAIVNGEQIVSKTNSNDLKVSDMPATSMYADRVLGNYEAMFGRQADGEGAMYWTNQLHSLRGSGLSEAEANARLDEIMLTAGQRNGENVISTTGSSVVNGDRPANVDAISDFVSNLYDSNLGRDADGRGGIYWERQRQTLVSSGASEADAQRQIEAQFRNAARDNGEQTSTSSFVNNLYSNNLGRSADSAGAQFWDSHYDNLVGSGLSASKAQRRVENDFMSAARANGEVQTTSTNSSSNSNTSTNRTSTSSTSNRSSNTGASNATASRPTPAPSRPAPAPSRPAPASNSGGSFVDNLYSNNLGRSADSAGANFWSGQLNNLTSSGMSQAEAQRTIERQFIEGARRNGELP